MHASTRIYSAEDLREIPLTHLEGQIFIWLKEQNVVIVFVLKFSTYLYQSSLEYTCPKFTFNTQ